MKYEAGNIKPPILLRIHTPAKAGENQSHVGHSHVDIPCIGKPSVDIRLDCSKSSENLLNMGFKHNRAIDKKGCC